MIINSKQTLNLTKAKLSTNTFTFIVVVVVVVILFAQKIPPVSYVCTCVDKHC